MSGDWLNKPVSFTQWLEALTFMLALYLYGWASDRSQEPLIAVGWLVCGWMYLRNMMTREN